MRFVDRLERKCKGRGIKNLMLYIVGLNIVGIFITLINPDISSYLVFIPERVLKGEIWRFFTLFLSPITGLGEIFMVLILYFTYRLGVMLEELIGTFKLNLFYFTGIFLMLVTSLVTGIPIFSLGSMNISLFLALAIVAPNMEFMLFFFIPVKAKYLALFDVAIILYEANEFYRTQALLAHSLQAIFGSEVIKMLKGLAFMTLLPLVNALIFYFLFVGIRNKSRQHKKVAKQYKQEIIEAKNDSSEPRHRCTVCGRTELDNENLEFRYCTKCNGDFEYCSDHIFSHEHKQ